MERVISRMTRSKARFESGVELGRMAFRVIPWRHDKIRWRGVLFIHEEKKVACQEDADSRRGVFWKYSSSSTLGITGVLIVVHTRERNPLRTLQSRDL